MVQYARSSLLATLTLDGASEAKPFFKQALRFRSALAALPKDVQSRARKAYRLWRNNPGHPSLHFKKIGKLWSARVDSNHRALARIVGDKAYWFWVGPHAEYERLIGQLQ